MQLSVKGAFDIYSLGLEFHIIIFQDALSISKYFHTGVVLAITTCCCGGRFKCTES